MKNFALILLIAVQAYSAEVKLDVRESERLLKRIQTCSSDKCWNESLSSEISSIEKKRTREWVKKFKITDSQKWYPCKLKLRPVADDEVCFAQPEDANKDEEVRMIFKKEGSAWRLKHLSLPSPTLGW